MFNNIGMHELDELYQSIILDHYKHPRNAHSLECPTHSAEGYNATCGDELQVTLQLKDGFVHDIGFTGQGCAISQASASLMTQKIKGKSQEDALQYIKKIYAMLTDPSEQPHNSDTPTQSNKIDLSHPNSDELGDLIALSGTRQFPARIKCATLAWHTLESALCSKGKTPTES